MKCASEMGKQNTHAQVHTYNNLYDCEQVSVVGGGGGGQGSEKDFRWIFSYLSIYWHISALMVLQQMMRFLGGKPKHTDKNILKLKILSFHSCS